MNIKKPKVAECFPDWASVFIIDLAFWIGAHSSQGAATGTWLRCQDEVSTVQNLAWIIYKMGN